MNFIGSILGPRGNNHKRLEKETGCKVSVRGKGAEKSTHRVRNPRCEEGADKSLHVFITAPTEDNLQRAIELIEPLLLPQTDEARAEQMKELAMINGTFRFEMRCRECGEFGHKNFQCPSLKNTHFANIQCTNCGDLSHVTSDCPKKGLINQSQEQIDSEYQEFLAELSGNPLPGNPVTNNNPNKQTINSNSTKSLYSSVRPPVSLKVYSKSSLAPPD